MDDLILEKNLKETLNKKSEESAAPWQTRGSVQEFLKPLRRKKYET